MPVLKLNQSTRQSKEAVVLDLGDLGRQAERLRHAAEQRAQQILEDAQAEAQKLIDSAEARGQEQGYAVGYEKGCAEGREQGRSEACEQLSGQLGELTAGFSAALEQWDQQRADMQRQASAAVLDLALALAQRIVHRTADTDPTIVVDQVGSALSHILRKADATVRINPEDRPILEEALPELAQQFHNLTHIHLTDDPAIDRGGCLVQYGQGEIDATIETQLDRITGTLKPDPERPSDPSTTEIRDP